MGWGLDIAVSAQVRMQLRKITPELSLTRNRLGSQSPQ